MSDLVTQLVTDLILIVAALAGAALAWVVRSALGPQAATWIQKVQEELIAKQDLVRLAVMYAQQYWAELDGPERYEKAVEWLTNQAKRIGIEMTDDEMRGLIEASVKQLKAEFGEAWKDQKH